MSVIRGESVAAASWRAGVPEQAVRDWKMAFLEAGGTASCLER